MLSVSLPKTTHSSVSGFVNEFFFLLKCFVYVWNHRKGKKGKVVKFCANRISITIYLIVAFGFGSCVCWVVLYGSSEKMWNIPEKSWNTERKTLKIKAKSILFLTNPMVDWWTYSYFFGFCRFSWFLSLILMSFLNKYLNKYQFNSTNVTLRIAFSS